MNSRVRKLSTAFLIMWLVIAARLVYLQGVMGNEIRVKARNSRTHKVTLPAIRGDVLDRHGNRLTTTEMLHVLVCDPTLVISPSQTASLLSGIIDRPPSEIVPYLQRRRLANGRPSRNIEIGNVEYPWVDRRLHELKLARSSSKHLAGVFIRDRYVRRYPYGDRAVHIVGICKPSNGSLTGIMGAEMSFDSVLTGWPGFKSGETDPAGWFFPLATESVDKTDGNDVVTTIDQSLQCIVADGLYEAAKQARASGASATVLDPRTGDIIAMASFPAFDPYSRSELKSSGEPLRNRTLMPFEPGGVVEPLIAAWAIDSGVLSEHQLFNCNGSLQLGKRRIHDFGSKAGSHGTLDLGKALRSSCNVTFAQVGLRLGSDRLKECFSKFGLLDELNLGIGPSGKGYWSRESGPSKAARLGFGQSLTVCPTALTAAYACLSNQGILVRPRLVTGIADREGHMIKNIPLAATIRVLETHTAESVYRMLDRFPLRVTRHKGRTQVFVAGNGGVAQKVRAGERGYSRKDFIYTYIGYLPAGSPRAIICISIDSPGCPPTQCKCAIETFKTVATHLANYWDETADSR